MPRSDKLKLTTRFCLDCNVPVAFDQILTRVGIKFWRAPGATPDKEIAHMAQCQKTPIITANIVDFLPFYGSVANHPGLIAFSCVSARHGYTSLHQSATFSGFAAWAADAPSNFNYDGKLLVLARDGTLTTYDFDVRAIHKLDIKTRKRPLPQQIRHWHYCIRRALAGSRVRSQSRH